MLHFHFRSAALSVALIASFRLATQAAGQQPLPAAQAPSQQPPTLSITTHEVLVDVVVSDKDGQPVKGLTAANFTVTEEGDPQHIAHLEEHFPMSAEDLARLTATPALPLNTFTNYTPIANTNSSTVILLDALNSRIETQMELREQLIDYVKHMQPGTPIAIFQLDTEMRLIQGFTSDPKVLLDAAGGKRDMPQLQKLIRGSPDEYRRARMDILHAGFQMMGRYLNGFPGRKNLIWLTGAIPHSYLADPLGSSFGKSFRDQFDVLNDNPDDLTDALTLSRVAVYPIDARGLQTLPQFQASNRGGSPRGGMGFEASQAYEHMDLDSIADATGGRAYYNSNGLKQAISQIVNNGSNYYTLAYATTNKTWDGQFRHIKVKLDRPGVRVQYRQGYYAIDRAKLEQRLLAALQKRKAAGNPFSQDETASSDTGEDTAPSDSTPAATKDSGALIHHPKGGFEATMQLGAIPPTEVVFTAALSIDNKVVKLDKKAALPADNYMSPDYKGKPFRVYTVHIHADAHALRLTPTARGFHQGTIEFVTLVFDQVGAQVNSLLTTAVLNVTDAHYRQILSSGLGAEQKIAVPVKGNYFLRIGVHDVASDHIGGLEIPVEEIRDNVAGLGIQKP
jgi:VWFA-related protein